MSRMERAERLESAASDSSLVSLPSNNHASSRLSTIVDCYRWPTSTSTATQVFTSQVDQATSADDLPSQLSAKIDRATSALSIDSLLAESDTVKRAARESLQIPPVVAARAPLSVAPGTPTASLGATPSSSPQRRSSPQGCTSPELSPIAKPPGPDASTSISFEEMERRCLAERGRETFITEVSEGLAQQVSTQGLSSPFHGHMTNEGFHAISSHVGGCNMGALSDKDSSEARPQPFVPTPAS